jgi:sarcosine oxidase delta subunit
MVGTRCPACGASRREREFTDDHENTYVKIVLKFKWEA